MHILLKLSVKAGKTGISNAVCNQVNRLLIQMKIVAGLLNAIMLNIFQRTDSYYGFKNPAKMAFAYAAISG